ncbi:uncharacterized protein LOC116019438 [Ipomoea triloba]|uniref:uncharacterized protein LOC116019438 n=1 Tax=Ipomoea triloba TaxID=35885 RepID=UPI00125DDE2C|nr:uncharacterized protein LOC116019438 [Ipomoea triloba]
MKSLSSIGLALSVIFGCLLIALLAELYYLLWWKKRITRRGIEDGPGKEIFYFFCGKKPSSSSSSSSSCSGNSAMKPQEICSRNTLVHEPQPQVQSPHGDESMEVELLRLSGPPRFLFTIKEETKEDLESSEDGKSKSRKGSRTRSLSDVLETPFLTPIASPPYFTPPLTPLINPFFESTTDFEFSSKPSPPPTFKFLRDAEEKLHRSRILEEKTQRLVKKKEASASSSHVSDKELAQISPPFLSAQENAKFRFSPSPFSARDEENNGSFITLIFPRTREEQHGNNNNNLSVVSHYPSSSSQVLPLATSPPAPHSPLSRLRPLHTRSFTR